MAKLFFLMAAVALCCLLVQTSARCQTNADCVSLCPDPADAVCTQTTGECHCHDHGEITCRRNRDCRRACRTPTACCHADHHCHCNEPCA